MKIQQVIKFINFSFKEIKGEKSIAKLINQRFSMVQMICGSTI